MGDGREAGVFMGHTEGLTYVDSKGDGRYVLSNGKDQTMKLWDLRKMMTTAKFQTINPSNYTTGFDYRFEPYPDDYYEKHEHDCSVVTFRGHRVLKTLIRCHFSPPDSTNSRYVYSGSEDGKVYVYNMDATLAGTIDVGAATLNSRPREPDLYATAYEMSGEMLWRTCVRDASWHPNAPILAGITFFSTTRSWTIIADKTQQQPHGTVGACRLALALFILGTRVLPMMKVIHQLERATMISCVMCPSSTTTRRTRQLLAHAVPCAAALYVDSLLMTMRISSGSSRWMSLFVSSILEVTISSGQVFGWIFVSILVS